MKLLLCMLLLLPLAAIAQTCEHDASVHSQIALVEFVGAESVDPASLAAIISDLQKNINDECQLGDELSERARDGFQRIGYFKALTHQRQLTELEGTPKLRRFAVKIKVDPGAQYRLDHVAFSGETVFSDSELRAAVPMNDGDLFDVQKMRTALQNLRDKYGARGYINSTPVPNTEIDDERKRIVVTFDLDEGDQYRFGKLIIVGEKSLPPQARVRLTKSWLALEGKTFTSDDLKKYVEQNHDILSSGSLDHRELVKLATKTVDYVVGAKETP
jgi:outer membrane protein assembly factor BamA